MSLHIINNIDAEQILKRKGLEPNGKIQRFLVGECDRNMMPYMPFLSGMQMKNRVVLDNGIHYIGPYARYLYMGKAMVNAATGNGPALIPNVGYRFPKGSSLVATQRDLQYTKTKNLLAGPYWDVRMWGDRRHIIMDAVMKKIGETH